MNGDNKVNAVDTLMADAIDMHVHFAPESLMERRQNALQLARTAKEYGLSALVLKCREYCTVPIAKNRRHYASSSGRRERYTSLVPVIIKVEG